MLLNFYVQGRAPGSAPSLLESEEGFFATAAQKAQEKVTALHGMSWDEVKEEAERRAEAVLEMGRSAFRFLSGEEVARAKPPPMPVQEHKQEQEKKGWLSSVTGLFSGIKGTARSSAGSSSEAWNGPALTEGEVHADLVMVCIMRPWQGRCPLMMSCRTERSRTLRIPLPAHRHA